MKSVIALAISVLVILSAYCAAATSLSLSGTDFMVSASYICPWDYGYEPEISWTLEAYGSNGCALRLEAGDAELEWRITRKGLEYLGIMDIDALILKYPGGEWIAETDNTRLEEMGEGDWALLVRIFAGDVETLVYYPETEGLIQPETFSNRRG